MPSTFPPITVLIPTTAASGGTSPGTSRARRGERFGFQLTFFRFRISAERHERRSAWAPAQMYMAHFAVSDVAARRFHAFERYSRGALDLAGARAAPFRVWIEDWSASLRPRPR